MNKALLVGINQYAAQPGLAGCINDVDDVKQALLDRGTVRAADIVVLTDDQATKPAILDGLTAMIAQLRPGDRGYFHFSGHGVRMASNDLGEPDGLDEILCPYEFDWTADTAIADDEVLQVLAALRLDSRMVLTIDSCHSGDQGRLLSRPGVQYRTLTPPNSMMRTRGAVKNGFRVAARAPNISFVSACSPWQQAADTSFDGRPNGAFTYYFLKQVAEGGYDATLDDVVLAIEPVLRLYEMTPVAENGDVTYHPVRQASARTLARTTPLHSPVATAVAGAVVFHQVYRATVMGQEVGVAVQIAAQNGELSATVGTTFMGQNLTTPPLRISGDATIPVVLGILGARLNLAINDWRYLPQGTEFGLDISITSQLPFVPRVHVARQTVHVDLAGLGRALATPPTTSPADLVALLTLQQLERTGAAQGNGPPVRASRDPRVQVFANGGAGWGPNWREDRIIRPFANRPRPEGIVRTGVPGLGPQRGAGNVYVVGWLTNQESDFDFILHMGNHFFGGWGEIDWWVEGIYFDDQPFPRSARPAADRPAREERPSTPSPSLVAGDRADASAKHNGA